MAIPDMTEAELRTTIKALVNADSAPVLSSAEIDVLVRQSYLVDKNRKTPDIAFERVGNTVYAVGQRMVPMNRNGHTYVCTTAGTTAATEPTFPGTSEEIVTDGTVEWTEAGLASWVPTYDQFAAIGDGWEMKAAKLVGNYQFASDGQTFNRQQVYDHCMEMASSWKRRKNGSVSIISSVRKRGLFPDAFTAQLPEQVIENLGWGDA